jgi:hypothetical protein
MHDEPMLIPRYEAYYETEIAYHEDALDRYGNWLAGSIRLFDPQSDHIGVLRDILEEMRRVLAVVNQITHAGSDETRYGIDMTDLPSVPIPDGITTEYPIWAMDAHGNVLVGDVANQIVQITSIILYGRYVGLGATIQYDPDAPIRVADLPEPIKSWYHNDRNRGRDLGEDTDGFVYDPHEPDDMRLTWEEVVHSYGWEVWGID